MKFSKLIYFFLLLSFTGSLYAQVIATFPYEEGFESSGDEFTTEFPAGWVVDSLSTPSPFNLGWVINDSNGNLGPKSAFIPGIPNFPNNDWLITPPISIKKDHTYTFSFWYRIGNAGAPTISLHLGNQASHASMDDVPLWTNSNITNTVYQQATVEYLAMQNDTIHFGFHAVSEPIITNFLLDDIRIEEDMPTSLTNSIDDSDEINIYPNPADDFINIVSVRALDYAEIYSLDGKLISTHPLSLDNSSIPLGLLSKGTYIIKIYSKTELLMTKRFLKMKK